MADKALGSILNDIGANAVQHAAGSVVPVLGYPLGLANTVRYMTGSMEDKPDMDLNQVAGAAWIPTLGSARMGKRRAILSNTVGSNNKRKAIHLFLGRGVNIAGSTALGALIGAFAGRNKWSRKEKTRSVVKGALAGAGVSIGAQLLGAIAAALTAKRTLAEQKAYELSGAATAANYLLPGAPTYNYWKSMGTMLGDLYLKAREKNGKKKGVSKKAGLLKTPGTLEWWSHEGAGKGVKIGGITGATLAGVPAFARWTLLRGGNPVLKLLGGLIGGAVAAGTGALGGGIIGGAAGGLFGPKKKKPSSYKH